MENYMGKGEKHIKWPLTNPSTTQFDRRQSVKSFLEVESNREQEIAREKHSDVLHRINKLSVISEDHESELSDSDILTVSSECHNFVMSQPLNYPNDMKKTNSIYDALSNQNQEFQKLNHSETLNSFLGHTSKSVARCNNTGIYFQREGSYTNLAPDVSTCDANTPEHSEKLSRSNSNLGKRGSPRSTDDLEFRKKISENVNKRHRNESSAEDIVIPLSTNNSVLKLDVVLDKSHRPKRETDNEIRSECNHCIKQTQYFHECKQSHSFSNCSLRNAIENEVTADVWKTLEPPLKPNLFENNNSHIKNAWKSNENGAELEHYVEHLINTNQSAINNIPKRSEMQIIENQLITNKNKNNKSKHSSYTNINKGILELEMRKLLLEMTHNLEEIQNSTKTEEHLNNEDCICMCHKNPSYTVCCDACISFYNKKHLEKYFSSMIEAGNEDILRENKRIDTYVVEDYDDTINCTDSISCYHDENLAFNLGNRSDFASYSLTDISKLKGSIHEYENVDETGSTRKSNSCLSLACIPHNDRQLSAFPSNANESFNLLWQLCGKLVFLIIACLVTLLLYDNCFGTADKYEKT